MNAVLAPAVRLPRAVAALAAQAARPRRTTRELTQAELARDLELDAARERAATGRSKRTMLSGACSSPFATSSSWPASAARRCPQADAGYREQMARFDAELAQLREAETRSAGLRRAKDRSVADSAHNELRRAEAKHQRVQIEIRGVLDVARQALGPAGGDMPPAHAAQLAELQARATALEPELSQAKTAHAAAAPRADQAQAELRRIQGQVAPSSSARRPAPAARSKSSCRCAPKASPRPKSSAATRWPTWRAPCWPRAAPSPCRSRARRRLREPRQERRSRGHPARNPRARARLLRPPAGPAGRHPGAFRARRRSAVDPAQSNALVSVHVGSPPRAARRARGQEPGRVRRAAAQQRVEKQHRAGKLTARERIDALVDPGQLHRDRSLRHASFAGPERRPSRAGRRRHHRARAHRRPRRLRVRAGLHGVRRRAGRDARQQDREADGSGAEDRRAA